MVVLNDAQFLGRLIPAALTDYYGGADMLLFAQVLIGILALHWITVATLGKASTFDITECAGQSELTFSTKHHTGGFVEFLVFMGIFSGMLATLPATVIPYICPNPGKRARSLHWDVC